MQQLVCHSSFIHNYKSQPTILFAPLSAKYPAIKSPGNIRKMPNSSELW